MSTGQIFVLIIVGMAMFAGVAKTAIKFGNTNANNTGRNPGGDLDAERRIHLLSSENERLVGQVSRLEERIAVLERIATDPAERVAREIDALR